MSNRADIIFNLSRSFYITYSHVSGLSLVCKCIDDQLDVHPRAVNTGKYKVCLAPNRLLLFLNPRISQW